MNDELDRLILARHGSVYGLTPEGQLDVDPELSPQGIVQAQFLAVAIKEIVGDDIYYIFTSPTRRTKQTASIIDDALKYPFYGHHIEADELDESVNATPSRLNSILQLITNHPYKGRGATTTGKRIRGAILVTHHTIIPPLASLLSRHYQFPNEIKFEQDEEGIREGHAVYLDCNDKTYRFLPR